MFIFAPYFYSFDSCCSMNSMWARDLLAFDQFTSLACVSDQISNDLSHCTIEIQWSQGGKSVVYRICSHFARYIGEAIKCDSFINPKEEENCKNKTEMEITPLDDTTVKVAWH